MAALAPAPFRPSSALLSSNNAPSSSSTTDSATPPRKQENSAAVAAGRRRLDEFQRKKAAGRGKKTGNSSKGPVSLDHSAQDGSKGEQRAVPSTSSDSSISANRAADSNGFVSKTVPYADSHVVPAPARETMAPAVTAPASLVLAGAIPTTSPPRVAISASVPSAEIAPANVPITGPTLTSSPFSVATASDGRSHLSHLAPRPQGKSFELATKDNASLASGNNDAGARDSQTATSEQAVVGSRRMIPVGAAKPLFVPGLSPARPANLGSLPPVSGPSGGAAKPSFVPGPPPVRQETLGILTPASRPGKQEPVRSATGAVVSSSSDSNKDSQINTNSSSQKISSGNLVMLGSKLGPSKYVAELQNYKNSGEPERDFSESAKPVVSTAAVPSAKEKVTTDTRTEVEKGTPASSSLVKPINASLASASVPKSAATAPLSSLSEATPLKTLPLPPFRPPSSFKPVVSRLVPGLNSFPEATTSMGTSSSTVPSMPNSAADRIHHDAPIVPIKDSPPVSTIYPAQENGTLDMGDSIKSDLAKPSPALGDLPTDNGLGNVGNSRSSVLPSSGRDDFAMLEQYIADLTQEKFSLQRGVESFKAVVDTLGQENISLTKDYNRQGALVNDLKAETERQLGEIRAQAVVVKNMKAERDKAVQDSMSAVERSQALAAEVITLEEKVLRARSQELKLQRELETLSASAEAQKQQLMSLEKDRANLKTLIDALQEEKGLLQSQIRKVSATGGSAKLPRSTNRLTTTAAIKIDASTSTGDLDLGTGLAPGAQSLGEGHMTTVQGSEGPQGTGFQQPSEQHRRVPMIVPSLPSRPLLSPSHRSEPLSYPSEGGSVGTSSFTLGSSATSGRGLNLGPVASVIPADQAATIRNIDSLITELAEEKEALLKAIRSESASAAELRALNLELSHKLEVQTQRLELAVAQSMAYGSTPRVGNSYAVSQIAPEYVDEGDEVVDRVLGWIMQLFPGGSSRRKRL